MVLMDMNQAIGKVVGNLEIVAKIASGGMGTVYRAEHQTLRTPYAIKILHPRFSEDHTTAERFRREAITCSQLRHPNVVFVTDFGFHDDLGIYIIMEFLEGQPLSQAIKGTKMALSRVARIGEQICDALEASHAMNIVHRDMKPDNVFLVHGSRSDYTKVLDFGIAQIQQGEGVEKLTRAGLVLGTPAYISPEQINGKAAAVGPGADIYALGAILFEMICGAPPFTEGTDFEILSQHLFKAPAPISAHRPDVAGTRLEALVAAMLGKKPEERPASMSAVHTMLNEAISELREMGIQDAARHGISSGDLPRLGADTGQFPATMTPPPLRITNVIQHIRTNSPDSAVATLLSAFPGMASLQEEIFHMALWGVLQRDLLDHPLDTSAFKHATDQLTLFVQAVLNAASDDNGPKPDRLFRSISDLFTLSDKERQVALIRAMQPLTTHHLFPFDVLPEWARPRTTGTWGAIKSLMTAEIKIPTFSRPKLKVESPSGSVPDEINAAIAGPPPPPIETGQDPRRGAPAKVVKGTVVMHYDEPAPTPPPSPEAQAPKAPNPPSTEAPKVERSEDDGGYEESLAFKLNQDLSLSTLKTVLSHEFSLFKRKKKDDQG